MSKPDKILEVDALTYSDSFDGLVDRHFRNRPSHRADDTGLYNVEEMIRAFPDKLFRSRQEYALSPSGLTVRIQWASLLFRLEEDIFVIMFGKASSMGRNNAGDEYKLSVIAESPKKAVDTLSDLRKRFLPKHENQGPSFFIMTGGRRAERAVLEDRFRLTDELLALHYGKDLAAWSEDFMQSLAEPGISILCGETGTGKTSLIRHVMCCLSATHRFYFVPVDNFNMLSSGMLTEFWKAEQRDHPSAVKVLVLEDAETLLLERDHDGKNPVSSILNLTDGLMTQFIKVHLIATLNCKRERLDKALLRPGRLRFFRDIERLSPQRAQQIADHYDLEIEPKLDYSLAEIFGSKKFKDRTAGAFSEKGSIGFSVS